MGFNEIKSGSAVCVSSVEDLRRIGASRASLAADYILAGNINAAGVENFEPMGNAAESDLLRNRFDTNLGIEVERQNLKNTGIGNAMALGDTVNKWQTDDQNRARSLWDWEADKSRLPYELEGMGLANDTSAFALDTAKYNTALSRLNRR